MRLFELNLNSQQKWLWDCAFGMSQLNFQLNGRKKFFLRFLELRKTLSKQEKKFLCFFKLWKNHCDVLKTHEGAYKFRSTKGNKMTCVQESKQVELWGRFFRIKIFYALVIPTLFCKSRNQIVLLISFPCAKSHRSSPRLHDISDLFLHQRFCIFERSFMSSVNETIYSHVK